MKVLAIDPGEANGLVRVDIGDVSKLGEVKPALTPVFVRSVPPPAVYAELDHDGHGGFYDAVVIEEFRLYPWMAQYQSYSKLPTVKVIGVVEYLCAVADIPLYSQRADIKKEARSIAVNLGWSMKVRSLGSGKGKYRGPDFDYPGPQHPRDAMAHAVYWAYRNSMSPLKNMDAESAA